MLTFRDFKQGPAKRIAAAVPSSEEFRDLCNESVRQLMRRGNWFGCVQPLRGCIRNNCITWPRRIDSILAINACDHPIPVANYWNSFVPWDEAHYRCAGRFIQDGFRGNVAVEVDGTSPVFNPIPCGTDMYLLFYPSSPSDVNKTITIYGIDTNGQIVHGQRADKTWQDGIQITLKLPYAITPFKIRRVDRVVKDATNSIVRVYQWDGTSLSGSDPLLYDLAAYEASETNPDYLHSRVLNAPSSCCTCDGNRQITALVKLAYTPIQHDDDLVLIDNMDALRDFIISIREKEMGNINQSQAMELSAIRELNYDLRNRFPLEQFVCDFRPFGSARLPRQRIGQLI